jgi:hypothetical protein
LLRSIQKRLRSKNGAGRTRLRYVGTSWPRHPSFHHLMRRSISSFIETDPAEANVTTVVQNLLHGRYGPASAGYS